MYCGLDEKENLQPKVFIFSCSHVCHFTTAIMCLLYTAFILNMYKFLCVLQHTVEVLSLLSDDVETDDAAPGENLKLRLKGIEEEEILPGFILCSPDNLCHSGRTFDAQVMTTDAPKSLHTDALLWICQINWLWFLYFEKKKPLHVAHSLRLFQIVIIEHKSIICPGYNAVLHIHTCIEEVQITVSYCSALQAVCFFCICSASVSFRVTSWPLWTAAELFKSQLQALICLVDKKTGEKSKTRPRFVKQDQVCIARLRAAGVICLETFKDFPQMGRFTLRDEGKESVCL